MPFASESTLHQSGNARTLNDSFSGLNGPALWLWREAEQPGAVSRALRSCSQGCGLPFALIPREKGEVRGSLGALPEQPAFMVDDGGIGVNCPFTTADLIYPAIAPPLIHYSQPPPHLQRIPAKQRPLLTPQPFHTISTTQPVSLQTTMTAERSPPPPPSLKNLHRPLMSY